MVNIKNKIESIKDFITHSLVIYPIIFYTFIGIVLNVSTNLWNEYIVYPSVREEYVEIVGKPLEERRQYFKECFKNKKYPSEYLENLEFRISISATEELNEKDSVYFRQKIIKNRQKGIENLTEKEVQKLKERIEYKLSLYQNTYSIKSNNKLYKANLYPKQ